MDSRTTNSTSFPPPVAAGHGRTIWLSILVLVMLALAGVLGSIRFLESLSSAVARQLVDRNPSQFTVDGVAALERGNYEEALKLLQRGDALGDTRATRHIAWCYYNLDRVDEATQTLHLAIARHPDIHYNYTNLASLYSLLGNPAAEREVIRSMARRFEGTPHYNMLLGRHQVRRGNLEEGLPLLEQVLRRSRDEGLQSEAWATIGDALREQGNRDEAVEAYKESHRLRPGNTRIQRLLVDYGVLDALLTQHSPTPTATPTPSATPTPLPRGTLAPGALDTMVPVEQPVARPTFTPRTLAMARQDAARPGAQRGRQADVPFARPVSPDRETVADKSAASSLADPSMALGSDAGVESEVTTGRSYTMPLLILTLVIALAGLIALFRQPSSARENASSADSGDS